MYADNDKLMGWLTLMRAIKFHLVKGDVGQVESSGMIPFEQFKPQ